MYILLSNVFQEIQSYLFIGSLPNNPQITSIISFYAVIHKNYAVNYAVCVIFVRCQYEIPEYMSTTLWIVFFLCAIAVALSLSAANRNKKKKNSK